MPDAPEPADLEKLRWLASDSGPLGLFSPASRAAIARAVAELERLRAEVETLIASCDEARAHNRRLLEYHSLTLRQKADIEAERDEARAALDSDAATTRAAGEAPARVEALERELHAVISKAILHHPNGNLAVVAGWRLTEGNRGVVPCFEFFDDPSAAIEAVRAAAGLAPPDRPQPEGGPTP